MKDFFQDLWANYERSSRSALPWRQAETDGSFDPYKILVSEIMLQQTQVDRVVPKFLVFIQAYPTVIDLANAPFADVLGLWSGLGYNRRARFLHESAKQIANSGFPKTIDELVKLPGIGKNTAAAILTYSFNESHAFIETNVRTVFIHHFFSTNIEVSDAEIAEKVSESLRKQDNPREFMWAVMDYGTVLKQRGVRNIQQSKHYQKQSKFEGSKRQLRGELLRLAQAETNLRNLSHELKQDPRLEQVLCELVDEGFITVDKKILKIAS